MYKEKGLTIYQHKGIRFKIKILIKNKDYRGAGMFSTGVDQQKLCCLFVVLDTSN